MEDILHYSIEPLDTKTVEKPMMEKVLEIIKEIHFEDFEDYPFIEEQELNSMKSDDPFKSIKRYILRNSEQNIIGIIIQVSYKPNSPKYESSRHVAFTDLKIKKKFRRDVLGSKFVDLLKIKTKENGHKVMELYTSNTDIKAFAESLGLDILHKHILNRLNIEDIDWNLMDEWIEKSRKNAAGVELEMFTNIPEIDLKQYTELYTEALRHAPWGPDTRQNVTPETQRIKEKNLGEKRIEITVFCTRELDGDLSGLTEIFYDRLNPLVVNQQLTGVGEKYRNRGLGKWLKAHMIYYIKKTYPRAKYISTANALTNKPMRTINCKMGFKEITIFHLYRIKCD